MQKFSMYHISKRFCFADQVILLDDDDDDNDQVQCPHPGCGATCKSSKIHSVYMLPRVNNSREGECLMLNRPV